MLSEATSEADDDIKKMIESSLGQVLADNDSLQALISCPYIFPQSIVWKILL